MRQARIQKFVEVDENLLCEFHTTIKNNYSRMKTKCLIIMSFFVCLSVLSQNNVMNNVNREVKKLDTIAKLTDKQKKEIAEMLKAYYQHVESLKVAKDLVEDDEQSFGDNLKYMLTQSQYVKCAQYIKERQESKTSSLPKSK